MFLFIYLLNRKLYHTHGSMGLGVLLWNFHHSRNSFFNKTWPQGGAKHTSYTTVSCVVFEDRKELFLEAWICWLWLCLVIWSCFRLFFNFFELILCIKWCTSIPCHCKWKENRNYSYIAVLKCIESLSLDLRNDSVSTGPPRKELEQFYLDLRLKVLTVVFHMVDNIHSTSFIHLMAA